MEERRVFLDRFLKQVGRVEYLLNSEEFKLFARPTGDVERAINALPRASPEYILERMRMTLKVNENKDIEGQKACIDAINDFQMFAKRVAPVMNNIKDQLRNMVPVKETQNINYR